jgi:hypothetical protein
LGAISWNISQKGLSGQRFGGEGQHQKTSTYLLGQADRVDDGAGVNEVEADLKLQTTRAGWQPQLNLIPA